MCGRERETEGGRGRLREREDSTMCGFAPWCKSDTGNYDKLLAIIISIANRQLKTAYGDMSGEQQLKPASRRSRYKREEK